MHLEDNHHHPRNFPIGTLVRFLDDHDARIWDRERSTLVDVRVPTDTRGRIANKIDIDGETPALVIEVPHETRDLIRVVVRPRNGLYDELIPVQFALDIEYPDEISR